MFDGSPTLPGRRSEEAFFRFEEDDLIIGRWDDSGYYHAPPLLTAPIEFSTHVTQRPDTTPQISRPPSRAPVRRRHDDRPEYLCCEVTFSLKDSHLDHYVVAGTGLLPQA